MNIPSEAELIEIGRRFDFLLEIADHIDSRVKALRGDAFDRKATELENDAEILRSLSSSADDLIALVRDWVRSEDAVRAEFIAMEFQRTP
jgi:hypothetical protein